MRKIIDDLVIFLAGATFSFLLKGKTLWVREPIYGNYVIYSGKIEGVVVKRPAGNPEMVIRCSASRVVEGEKDESREFILTGGLNKIDRNNWELHQ